MNIEIKENTDIKFCSNKISQQMVSQRELWPSGTALAWHARGAGFESPRDQNFVLVPSVLSLPLV